MRMVSLALVVAMMASVLVVQPARAEDRTGNQAQPAQKAGVSTGWLAQRTMNVRGGPGTNFDLVGEVEKGTSLEVSAWVEGEQVTGTNNYWAQIGDGRYVYSNGLVKPKPDKPPEPAQKLKGRWLDANLTQAVLTAYYDDTPLYWAVMSSGRPDWETPTGILPINRRVLNETMDSDSLEVQGVDYYNIENVYFTQYFTYRGNAIHYNYWKWDSPFGVPTSHGCLGIQFDDSRFFWAYTSAGTPVVIHY
ncbi:MAG: L,D-transpeptidase family protein [Dehalococcoidales bacterium]|nr:L,D-transpeptidase family protein [Dehalococcoidales bacterium]